jgi:hypothetical protein
LGAEVRLFFYGIFSENFGISWNIFFLRQNCGGDPTALHFINLRVKQYKLTTGINCKHQAKKKRLILDHP